MIKVEEENKQQLSQAYEEETKQFYNVKLNNSYIPIQNDSQKNIDVNTYKVDKSSIKIEIDETDDCYYESIIEIEENEELKQQLKAFEDNTKPTTSIVKSNDSCATTQNKNDIQKTFNSNTHKYEKSINLKTYLFEKDADITKKLSRIGPTDFKNAFEIIIRDIKKQLIVKSPSGKDVVIFDTLMRPLKFTSFLNIFSRGNSQPIIGVLVNIKNNKNEYLSTLLDGFTENDRIIIFNGIYTNPPTIITNRTPYLRIEAEYSSSVIIFKHSGISCNINECENTSSTKFLEIRPEASSSKGNRSTNDKQLAATSTDYEENIMNLSPINLKSPTDLTLEESVEMESLVDDYVNTSPHRHQLKNKQLEVPQQNNKTNINYLFPVKPTKSANELTKLLDLDSSDDDNVNISPCHDLFKKSQQSVIKVFSSEEIQEKSPNIFQTHKNNCNSAITNSYGSDNSSRSSDGHDNLSDETMFSPETRDNSDTEYLPKTKTSNEQHSLKNKSISDCRLIFFEPCVYFEESDLVMGYCIKCTSFVSIPTLIISKHTQKTDYKCRICNTLFKCITYYFKMNFLYGEHQTEAIEVCCYNKYAEKVISKLVSKKITAEDYIKDNNNKMLIKNAFKSLLLDKTKLTICVEKSIIDNTSILLSIDL
ncbi:uncharacterized protein LOC126844439 [Adelges cooleyi]|uniref:uncharacterized protein LOC126844439 n=1 Tax=Adelges cooleyi TaxID=133065 RepID=UPI00218001C3|nr:uncharacterized protein LOC126844439 [Adelges cooleyi]